MGYLLFLAYALFVAASLLIGLLPQVVAATLYLVWRFLVAVRCLERIVASLEADAD